MWSTNRWPKCDGFFTIIFSNWWMVEGLFQGGYHADFYLAKYWVKSAIFGSLNGGLGTANFSIK